MTTLIGNGYSTENTSGTQGWQEAQGDLNLQQQTYQASGGSESRPPKKNRHITLENCSNVKGPFVIEDVATVSELVEKIFDRFPSANSDAIGLRISDVRIGSMHRKIFTEDLPADVFFLYVTLFLKKHPPVATK